jgi:sporulation protein YlmC with PRC-barrel domain
MSTVALSELLGATVRDATGAAGRVREIAVAPQEHATRVAFRSCAWRTANACCGRRSVRRDRAGHQRRRRLGALHAVRRRAAAQARSARPAVIDVHGRKVVRVNDVEIDATRSTVT